MSWLIRDGRRRAPIKLGLGGVLTALPVLAGNDPHDAARAVYKPLQLAAAAACGLAVPVTQVTNIAAAVRRLAADAGPGGIVTKAALGGQSVGERVVVVGERVFAVRIDAPCSR